MQDQACTVKLIICLDKNLFNMSDVKCLKTSHWTLAILGKAELRSRVLWPGLHQSAVLHSYHLVHVHIIPTEYHSFKGQGTTATINAHLHHLYEGVSVTLNCMVTIRDPHVSYYTYSIAAASSGKDYSLGKVLYYYVYMQYVYPFRAQRCIAQQTINFLITSVHVILEGYSGH